MLGKKSFRLVDLEYMIPKEHRKEAGVDESVPVEDAVARLLETCCACGKSSDDTILAPVFYHGADGWICPRCFKSMAELDMSSVSQPETTSRAEESSEPPSAYASEGQPYNPMSMFD